MKPKFLIVGLGNPGRQYERTRHNVGFRAVDVLATALGTDEWKEKAKFASVLMEGQLMTMPLFLVKPTTYMNASGDAIVKLMNFYNLLPEQVIVIVDDIDLPLADVRVRMSGGAGTHNGLKSIVQSIGESFPRIRIGLGSAPPGSDLSSWVLSRFTAEEDKAIEEVLGTLPDEIRLMV